MKRLNLLIPTLFILLWVQTGIAQLVTDGAINADGAVEVLLGDGVSAFNITFSGDDNQIGTFECTDCGIMMESGMIMASGNVAVAEGPNDGGGTTLDGGNFGATDADLELANPNFTINDAAVLEFDFIAGGDSVEFNYVWASEEYPEYVFSSFNDVFGFFLSGPGIDGPFTDGAENIAIIPDTDLPVTIDNVNAGNNDLGCTNCEYYVINTTNPDPNTIQFDGHTVVLTAFYSGLECGQTYHIKIALADAGDTAFDSAVFIEANSFTSNGVFIQSDASIDNPIFGGDSLGVEGCNEIVFTVNRADATMDETLTIQILGAAENGVDFEPPISTDVFMAEGVFSVDISISAIEDNIPEDAEELTLAYTFVNACGEEVTTTATIYIVDYIDPVVGAEDFVSPCPGYPIEISAFPVEGYSPFEYDWETGDSTQIIVVTPMVDTTYMVTAMDVCGEITTTDVAVTIGEAPELIVTATDVNVSCPGDFAFLFATVQQGTPDYMYAWDGQAPSIFADYFPQVNETTTIELITTDACLQADTIQVTVTVPDYDPLEVDFTFNDPVCPGDPVTITAQASGGAGGLQYNWNGLGFNQTISVNPQVTTTYTVTITDLCFQQSSETVEIEVPVYPEIVVDATGGEVYCPGDEIQVSVTAEGGLAPLTYNWENGSDETTTTTNPFSSDNFTITVTDACGQSQTGAAELIVPDYDPIIVSSIDSLCAGEAGNLQPITGGTGNYVDFFSDVEGLTFGADGTFGSSSAPWFYLVTVVDDCGNTGQATVLTYICDTYFPNVITPNDDDYNETFTITGLESFPGSSMKIYNRWGNLIYEDSNYTNIDAWDGEDYSDGTYYYVFSRSDGEVFNGSFSLFRK